MVMVRLYTGNQLSSLPGSALKVCVVVGGWWWSSYSIGLPSYTNLSKNSKLQLIAMVVVVESKSSDRLWLSFSLASA